MSHSVWSGSRGMDIVEALGQVATAGDDKPLEDVVLQSVTVAEVATDATDEEAED